MKFKNIKKEAKKKKSPSNYRTISSSVDRPEHLKFSIPKLNSVALLKIYRGSLKVFIVFIFLCTAVIVGIDLQKNIELKQNIDFQKGNLTKDLNFWEDFISEHQDYMDAYFQASILEYKLGDISKAKMYAEKGLSLDPNSESGKKLKQFLVNK